MPPFRRRVRNPVPRPEKENEAVQTELPLSPRLIRCKSDNTQSFCSELNLNKSLTNHTGVLSAEAKMSNLVEFNGALVKEVASLRISLADARNNFEHVESSLRAEKCKLQIGLSSLVEEASSLKEDKAALLVSQEQLQSSLCTSRAQAESLSQELAMVKSKLDQAFLIEKQALAASEERLLSANCDIERLCFNNKKLNEEIVTLKENAAMLASDKTILLEEKDEALRGKLEKEVALAALFERKSELVKLLHTEKKTVTDSKDKLHTLDKELEKLQAEKEHMMLKSFACEEETSERIRAMEEMLSNRTRSVDSLSLQIKEEIAKHQIAMNSATEESDRKLSDASTKLVAMEDLLQQSKGKADSISLQIQKERVKHQAETSSLEDKLTEATGKVKALEELLQQSNFNVDALKIQLKDDSAKHQLQMSSIQEKISAMAMKVSSLSAENQKLFAKKENLHKELSRVNQKQRETNEQILREMKSAADAQKCLQDVESDVKQLQLDQEKTLKEFHLLQDEYSQCCKAKEALLSEKMLLFAEKANLEASVSSLTLSQEKHADQCQAEHNSYATEKQGLLAELKKVQSAFSDLVIEQSDLLKQLNTEKMAVAAAQESIATLESTNQALVTEKFGMKSTFSQLLGAKEKELAAAEDNMSSLHGEVQKLRLLNAWLVEQAVSLKKQLSSMDIEKNNLLEKTKEMETAISELNSIKQTLQQTLEDANLAAKAAIQNDLELQVISLQNDLHAAQTASAKAEKDWKANMDTMLDSANARSRALEEQLESVKKLLCEMQNNANRGQESITSLQTQLLCLVEEKSSLEKKTLLLNPRSLEIEEPSDEEKKGEQGIKEKKPKVGLDEKAKLVRLALRVFLISTATSIAFAGIQSYMRGLEN